MFAAISQMLLLTLTAFAAYCRRYFFHADYCRHYAMLPFHDTPLSSSLS